jgi:hypothetical protein
LEDICSILNLPFDKIKFLSSGSFGNAYQIGDKVLKISLDKNEAKSVYDIINSSQKDGIVKYYDISRYKLGGDQLVYVILMDYATPLDKYLVKMKNWDIPELISYIEDITEIMRENWLDLESKEHFIQLISDEYEIPISGFIKDIIDKLWDLYLKIKKHTKSYPDLHPYNVGVKKDGSLVLFDFADLSTVKKFDQPRIIPGKLE